MENKDPRHKNTVFSTETVSGYLSQYVSSLQTALSHVPSENLERAVALLKKASLEGRRVYVAGNGGSAAIADHLCCDWTKGTLTKNAPPFRTHSLVSNVSLLTALINDYGVESCFSDQLEIFAEPGDIVVLISSSGNSKNIINAAETAKAMKLHCIGLSGFSGGKLKELADISLHVDFANYGLVEDSHQIIMHVFSQLLASARDQIRA